jgi:hypothetical protein
MIAGTLVLSFLPQLRNLNPTASCEKASFVSGHRFSDAANRSLLTAPFGVAVALSTWSAASFAAALLNFHHRLPN